ncbi:MAG: phosphate acyltransferase PlsX [Proteobacteria bacterium]|nr:phosphate acyltransferase PlsX [Pseudomonadota bacterium]MDA0846144.1 phosphate acyltransferase PlsX [Pseudomonadota bacterium]
MALDAMGGDNAPASVIDGADIAKAQAPHIEFIFVGDESRVRPLLVQTRHLQNAEILHTDVAVAAGDTASHAVRRGRDSSMWVAIAQVADKKADAVVSAGNTGALMAMSKLQLRTMPGVTRPAIAGFFPTEQKRMCMLDLGANLECDEDNLVQFALMGQAFYHSLVGKENPSVALLNVGSEEQKGHEYLRLAAQELSDKQLGVNYIGFVEGSDLVKGGVDIVVTDGFSGNIALKTAEGVAGLFATLLRRCFKASLPAKLGYLLARGALKNFRTKMDPRRYNGAVFLGLNGIAVKSHGGTDAVGFANAIDVAMNLVGHGFIPDVSSAIEKADRMRAKRKNVNE